MKKIAENTYDFEKLRKSGAIYVDKTALLHDLIADPVRQLYFIARPRRFGKSLMISTLRAIFDGRRDLLEGLAIAKKKNFEWQTHPVLQFNFSGVKTGSLDEFKLSFCDSVKDSLQASGFAYDDASFPGTNFGRAIRQLNEKHGKGVILLVDEYDAPIDHAFRDLTLADAIRNEMSNFYVQIKENERFVRFMMMTGVTQFAKMSVFSALSNLTDLSMEKESAGLLGYTKTELRKNFRAHMRSHARVMQLDDEKYMKKLEAHCDGYHFSQDTDIGVFNPVTIGINMARREKNFISAWANTGRASVLVNYLKREELAEFDYENIPGVSEYELKSCPLDFLPAITVLYQAGYLTIKNYSVNERLYTLGVPNDEVREDLSKMIVFSQKGEADGNKLFRLICIALKEARFEDAKRALQSYFAGYVYGSTEVRVCEAAYSRSLKTVLEACGFNVQAEVSQSQGRADLVAHYPTANFVFELKVDKPAELAIDQIKEKDYTLSYQTEELPLYAVGLTFDSATRNIKDMQAVQVK